jgi:hypothetical protein
MEYSSADLLNMSPEMLRTVVLEADPNTALVYCQFNARTSSLCQDDSLWMEKFQLDFPERLPYEWLSWRHNYQHAVSQLYFPLPTSLTSYLEEINEEILTASSQGDTFSVWFDLLARSVSGDQGLVNLRALIAGRDLSMSINLVHVNPPPDLVMGKEALYLLLCDLYRQALDRGRYWQARRHIHSLQPYADVYSEEYTRQTGEISPDVLNRSIYYGVGDLLPPGTEARLLSSYPNFPFTVNAPPSGLTSTGGAPV